MYLVANQEDLLRSAAGLRVNKWVLAGPLAMAPRAIVSALSLDDALAISNGQIRHFPLLIEIDGDIQGSFLERSIEITRVRRLHFRNSDERDRIANVQMRDLRLDNIATEVSPNLFASDSTSLAIGSPVANSAVEIQTADRVAGALCGALSSLGCLTASGQAVVNLFSADSAKFLDALTGVAFSVSDADGDAALLAAAGRSVMRAIESNEHDPSAISDLLVEETKLLGKERHAKVLRWRKWIQSRLDLDSDLHSSDLADPAPNKSVVLRAFTLLLFRKKLSSLLLPSSSDALLPGPTVAALAAAIAGFRDGLEQIDYRVKARLLGIVDAIACDMEMTKVLPENALTTAFAVEEDEGSNRVTLKFLRTGQLVVDTKFDRPPLLKRIASTLENAGFAVFRSKGALSVSDGGEQVIIEVDTTPASAATRQAKAPAPLEGKATAKISVGAPLAQYFSDVAQQDSIQNSGAPSIPLTTTATGNESDAKRDTEAAENDSSSSKSKSKSKSKLETETETSLAAHAGELGATGKPSVEHPKVDSEAEKNATGESPPSESSAAETVESGTPAPDPVIDIKPSKDDRAQITTADDDSESTKTSQPSTLGRLDDRPDSAGGQRDLLGDVLPQDSDASRVQKKAARKKAVRKKVAGKKGSDKPVAKKTTRKRVPRKSAPKKSNRKSDPNTENPKQSES